MLRCEAPKALIFDKDGTIIDVHHYWIEMSRLRIKLLLDKLSLSSEMSLSLNSYLQDKLGIDQKEQKIRKAIEQEKSKQQNKKRRQNESKRSRARVRV